MAKNKLSFLLSLALILNGCTSPWDDSSYFSSSEPKKNTSSYSKKNTSDSSSSSSDDRTSLLIGGAVTLGIGALIYCAYADCSKNKKSSSSSIDAADERMLQYQQELRSGR